jgi:AcrR family transcriptional regulator
MRALPGRDSRSSLAEPPAAVTRDSTHVAQRKRILRATAELIAKRGYNDVTVELIIKRARVSFKTFYSHFASKEDVFAALFDTATELATKAMRDAALEAGESWPLQIDAALRALFALIAADPATARACLVESLTAGPAFISRYEEALKGLVPLLEPGRSHSSHEEELPATLEDTVAGAVSWFLYQRLIVGELDELQEHRHETLEFVLRPYLGEVDARAAVAALDSKETSRPE